jgi:LAO/AO transport system kinase
LAHRPDMWNPPIVKTIATESRGIEDLAAAVESYNLFQKDADSGRERRQAIAKWRLLELLQERLLSDLLSRTGSSEKLESLAVEIADKRLDPYSAVEKLISG